MSKFPFLKLTPILVGLMALLAIICWVACGPSSTPIPPIRPTPTPVPVSPATQSEVREPQDQPDMEEGASEERGSTEPQVNIPAPIPGDVNSRLIIVMFGEDTGIDTVEEARSALPSKLRDDIDSVSPAVHSLSKEQLQEIGGYRLALWFRISLKVGTDPVSFLEALKALDTVEKADFASSPSVPSLPVPK